MILKEDEKQFLLEVVQKMSYFFWGPTLEQCQQMRQVPFWLPIEKGLLLLDPPADEVFTEIQTILNHYSTAQALFDGLEEEYVRLFISDRQGLQAPLYASCYVAAEPGERAPLMGEPALAMQDRFRSQGLSLADDMREPPDHLSIELEYLYFLLRKGWADNDNQLLKEASSFAAAIMLPWVMMLQQALAEIETAGRFYPLITALLGEVLKLIGGLNRWP